MGAVRLHSGNPTGRVVGLVGPNGAGKTTLHSLAAGLLSPTSGSVTVLGAAPATTGPQIARIGFVAQHTSLYSRLRVVDHLRLGAHMNPTWDSDLAQGRLEQLDLDPGQRAGSLSGGQRAQLALTLAIAKRPELLILARVAPPSDWTTARPEHPAGPSTGHRRKSYRPPEHVVGAY